MSNAPESAKPFLKSLNTTGFKWEQEHKPKGMKTEAPGINPSRWESNSLSYIHIHQFIANNKKSFSTFIDKLLVED